MKRLIASEVCKQLGIVNSRRALSGLDPYQKGVTSSNTLGGQLRGPAEHQETRPEKHAGVRTEARDEHHLLEIPAGRRQVACGRFDAKPFAGDIGGSFNRPPMVASISLPRPARELRGAI